MANSRLDPYRDDILRLVRERRTQAAILQHLAAEYGVTIRKSTLSEYIKKQTSTAPPPEPRVSPEEEHFLAQAEVYGELQASAQALLDKMNEVIAALKETGGAVYTLATDTERRDSALQDGFQQLQQTVASLPSRAGSPANAPNTPPTVTSGVPPQVVRRIWKRAFVITGIFWLVVYVLLRYYVFGRPDTVQAELFAPLFGFLHVSGL